MTDLLEHPEVTTSGGSLHDRIAARNRELEQQPEHTIVLPIPGYEDILAVQYRPLSYRESFKLEMRHEKVKDRAEQALLVGADKLVNACERIVEKLDDDTYKDTGHKWGLQAARDLFQRELPDGTTARAATIACFPDEEALVWHASELEEQRKTSRTALERDLEGESKGS